MNFRCCESEPHITAENSAPAGGGSRLPIEEAELLVEDELDHDGELDLRA